jgi:hypothetical protein
VLAVPFADAVSLGTLAPPGITNFAVVATAGMLIVVDGVTTPLVKGVSVPTGVAPAKAGARVPVARRSPALMSPEPGLRTL